jgi:hypothetical protein
LIATFAGAFFPRSLWACAACYGQSDSPMAAGMNWGIVSLLGIIVVVLGGVASFFIVLARRSAALSKSNNCLASDSRSCAALLVSAHQDEEAQTQPLVARGSFRRLSGLAQQRERCGQPQSDFKHLRSLRSRR